MIVVRTLGIAVAWSWCILAAQSALAGTVIVVGPAGGPGIAPNPQVAVNVAVDGDTLLVKPGTYPSFVINAKALDVIADGAGVKINGGFSVRNLTSRQKVMIRGLEATSAPLEDAIQIKNNQGVVYLESVRSTGAAGYNVNGSPFFHPSGTHAAVVVNSNATLVRCSLQGGDGAEIVNEQIGWFTGDGGSGVWCESSTVALLETSSLGGRGGNDWEDHKSGGDGGHGAYALQSTLVVLGSTLKGASGGFGGFETFSGCGNGGDGGAAIHRADAASQVFFAASELSAGKGGAAGFTGCSKGASPRAIDGPSYLALQKPVDLGVGSKRVSAPSPLRESGAAVLSIAGSPGDSVVLRMGSEFQSQFSVELSGMLVSTAATLVQIVPALPAAGSMNLPMLAPILPPGVLTKRLVIQGWFTDADREVVVSSPTIVTILDSSL